MHANKTIITKLRHIFALIFIFSVTSLTLQGTVVSFLKDSSTLKKQMYSSNAPTPAEEEDETGKTEIEEEDLFSDFDPLFFGSFTFSDINWHETQFLFTSRIVSIHTPPPEL